MTIALIVFAVVAGLGVGVVAGIWLLGRWIPEGVEKVLGSVDRTVASVAESVARSVRYPGGAETPVQVTMPTEDMFAGVDREPLREPGPAWMYADDDEVTERVPAWAEESDG